MNLKDPAIKINDSLTENKTCRGYLSHFIYGTLTYKPQRSPLCGAENNDYSIVKNGTKTSVINWLPLAHTPTCFVLKKQRFCVGAVPTLLWRNRKRLKKTALFPL